MVDYPAISGVDDPSNARVALVQGKQIVHAPLSELGFEPGNANLTSWAAIARAAGFDAFVATPSSANLATLVTGETGSGALVFGTTPTLNGPIVQTNPIDLQVGQIKFPAAQNASANANTLDDYEEGTYTPTVLGSTVAGAGTYATQIGSYTKIGDTVIAHGFVDWTAHTGTGNLVLGGLPFSVSSLGACSIMFNTLTFTAGSVVVGRGTAGTATIQVMQFANGGAAAAVPMDAVALAQYTIVYKS